MREVRTSFHISQRVVAEQIGISRDQLNRIERTLAAPRFTAAWSFCELTKTNPLWLAFGGPYGRVGFAPGDLSDVPGDAPFLEVMRSIEREYNQYRAETFKIPDDQRRIRFMMAFDPEPSIRVAPKLFKEYLTSEMAPPPNALRWESLRARLHLATRAPGAKAALAERFEVSPAAVSQWLSGASAPTADTTLRLLEWVTAEEAQQQTKRTGRASTRPALKTREGKSTNNEKTKSGP